ncbi:MAG: hypothetical protein ABSD88_20545, partial [Candidatus Korobacteraceae bacterium]
KVYLQPIFFSKGHPEAQQSEAEGSAVITHKQKQILRLAAKSRPLAQDDTSTEAGYIYSGIALLMQVSIIKCRSQ